VLCTPPTPPCFLARPVVWCTGGCLMPLPRPFSRSPTQGLMAHALCRAADALSPEPGATDGGRDAENVLMLGQRRRSASNDVGLSAPI
jgi:hypothetical protein